MCSNVRDSCSPTITYTASDDKQWVQSFPLMLLTNDQDVVKLLHAVNLGQKLVDNSVVHACAAGARSSLLADGVQLVKDNDVKATVSAQLKVRITL